MIQVNCQQCQKEFYVKPSHLKLGYGKYCSRICRDLSFRKGIYVNCEICKKEIWRMPKDLKFSKSGKYFCSKSCQTIWRNQYYSGTDHYLWRGGASAYRDRMIRSSQEQICIRCKNNDLRVLAVHHKDFSRKNNELDNLVWLCRNCHCLVHILKEKI